MAMLALRDSFAAEDGGSLRQIPFWEMLKTELVAVLPMLIIMGGAILFFSWYFRRKMKSPEYRSHMEQMKRIEEALQRIAAALERRGKDGD